MASLKDRIVDVLVSTRLLKPEQLQEALKLQQARGGSLQKILVERGFVKERDLLAAVSQELNIPPISLSRLKIDPVVKALISRDLATQYQVVPISRIGQTLTVAMADPLNIFALDNLTNATGLTVNPLLASAKDIQEAIDLNYGTGVEESVQELARKREADAEQAAAHVPVEAAIELSQEAPVVRFTNALLTRAVRMRASDLLIEPMETRVRVRYRVDGILQEVEAPPKHLQEAVVSRIKVMSELNIAERRLPQDGHFSFKVDETTIDFRVSLLPCSFGENVVLRILDKSQVKLDINDLGFAPRDLEILRRCAEAPHGLILTTGPTGSGKTTTLYAMLKHIDRPEKNLVTVEDPVEFELAGINQVSTRADIGLTFAKSLRSILRQDPDVIMVGEIRDAETADMAIKSALTGHLVLSTLHTNSAAGTVVRLANMGVEPFLINSCLRVIIAQRLVRRICAKCTQPYRPPHGVAEKLGLLDARGQPLELARGAGCEACGKSGYRGREVAAEVLTLTPEVRELILRRGQEREIEAAARAAGLTMLREHALQKVRDHVTTLEEVFRTTVGELAEG